MLTILIPIVIPMISVAKQARTPVGHIATTDLVVFRSDSGSAHVGFIELFVQIPAGAQPAKQTYAIVQLLKNLGGRRCSKAARGVKFAVVHASRAFRVFRQRRRGVRHFKCGHIVIHRKNEVEHRFQK